MIITVRRRREDEKDGDNDQHASGRGSLASYMYLRQIPLPRKMRTRPNPGEGYPELDQLASSSPSRFHRNPIIIQDTIVSLKGFNKRFDSAQ
jgi:hypothetical protein